MLLKSLAFQYFNWKNLYNNKWLQKGLDCGGSSLCVFAASSLESLPQLILISHILTWRTCVPFTNGKSTCYVLNAGTSSSTVNLAPTAFLAHKLVLLAVCRPRAVWYQRVRGISFMAEWFGQQFLMSNRSITWQKIWKFPSNNYSMIKYSEELSDNHC